MICFDRENPESARLLALHGAEVILVPNACGVGKQLLDQVRKTPSWPRKWPNFSLS
jgi:predicted amidohydrolase